MENPIITVEHFEVIKGFVLSYGRMHAKSEAAFSANDLQHYENLLKDCVVFIRQAATEQLR